MLKRLRSGLFLSCLNAPIEPSTTVIVFDLHNVIFKKQTRKIVMQGLQLMRQGRWRYTLSPRMWYRLYTIQRRSHVAEDIFYKMAHHYPGLHELRDDVIRMTNFQRPIVEVMALIKALKQQGYALYILSNIGAETYQKLCVVYPELAQSFDGAFTAVPDNAYLHKPDPAFYELFKEYLATHGQADKQILFIDDLKKNLIAAHACNISGIQYISPQQLMRTFCKLSVLERRPL